MELMKSNRQWPKAVLAFLRVACVSPREVEFEFIHMPPAPRAVQTPKILTPRRGPNNPQSKVRFARVNGYD
jgi:hypothetical protein